MGEHDFLEGEDHAGLGRRLVRRARIYFSLALNSQHHLVVVIEQIGPERLGPGLIEGPLNDEDYGHLVLGSREPRGTQLIEDAGYVELAVLADLRVVAGQ